MLAQQDTCAAPGQWGSGRPSAKLQALSLLTVYRSLLWQGPCIATQIYLLGILRCAIPRSLQARSPRAKFAWRSFVSSAGSSTWQTPVTTVAVLSARECCFSWAERPDCDSFACSCSQCCTNDLPGVALWLKVKGPEVLFRPTATRTISQCLRCCRPLATSLKVAWRGTLLVFA